MPKFARAGGDSASPKKCAQQPAAVNNSPARDADYYPADVLAEFRLRGAVEKIDALGGARVRVVYELLLELSRRHQILGDIAALASKYAERLTIADVFGAVGRRIGSSHASASLAIGFDRSQLGDRDSPVLVLF